MALIVEAVVLLVSLALTASAAIQIQSPFATSPWLMPVVIGGAMSVIAAILVVSDVRKVAAGVVRLPSRSELTSTTSAKMAGWLALSVGYGVMAPVVGFEWATIAFLAVALHFFAKTKWWLTLAIALAFAFVVPFVFRNVFFTLVP